MIIPCGLDWFLLLLSCHRLHLSLIHSSIMPLHQSPIYKMPFWRLIFRFFYYCWTKSNVFGLLVIGCAHIWLIDCDRWITKNRLFLCMHLTHSIWHRWERLMVAICGLFMVRSWFASNNRGCIIVFIFEWWTNFFHAQMNKLNHASFKVKCAWFSKATKRVI